MNLIKSANIAGHSWQFKWEDIDKEDGAEGECFYDDKIIQITPKKLHSENALDTLCHEVLHAAAGPFLTEDEVIHLSNAVSHVVWLCGYRAFPEKHKPTPKAPRRRKKSA